MRPTVRLRQFAKHLRHHQTDCEQLLWQKLRARQLLDLKFRRQFPCAPYILDFYCPDLKLAIELDGGQHTLDAARKYDQQRTRFLEHKGISVLRFSNLDILQQLENVLEHIARFKPSPAPLPTPPPRCA
ncbi:hypothetical protein D9M71_158690 [compost metagenome]